MIAEYLRPRTDNDLAGRVRSVLAKSRIPAICRVGVEEDSTGIVLTGKVSLFYYKQLAQEVVRAELDGVAILNRIEVVDPA